MVPGFIDAHMHIESSKLTVDEFARAVLPHGTTTVVADPHEIANVLGTDGIHWLLDCCEDLPLDVYVMASSCVPASPFQVAAACASTTRPRVAPAQAARARSLAEMMNFPASSPPTKANCRLGSMAPSMWTTTRPASPASG